MRTSLESPEPALVPTILLVKPNPASGQTEACLKVFQASTFKSPQALWIDREIAGEKDNRRAVVLTQFIQTPKITKVSLERKLVLPEGKTAVLFGWKQTTEVTDTVPVLSKLPIVGKHYQRVRKEPETVLVLVTPRVVVPEKTEEVLPTKACEENQAVKRAGCAEERVAPPNVDDLLTKYHAACAAGKFEKARKIAVRALKMDPTCFDRKR